MSQPEPEVWVIRDCRNASLDYRLPLSRAKQLHGEGKLAWDATNRSYSA
jgi:hypothetical protein